jgi:RND family efflux transporter MFP subunit
VRHRASGRLAALTIVIVAAGCGGGADGSPPTVENNATSVTTAAARIDTLRDDLVATGVVVPSVGADWTVYAPQAGLVAELPKALGDPVAVGDLLARFDILSISQEISAKQTLLTLATQRADEAKQHADQLERLWEQGLIARNELEAGRTALGDAQMAVTGAQSALDLTQVLADTTRITARFAGIVYAVWKAQGDFVDGTSDDPVLRVVDPTRTQIAIEIPLGRVGQVQAGRVATILLPTGETTVGSVTRVDVSTDPSADTVGVRLGYQSTEPLELDTAVRVEMVLDERRDIVVVPEEAILRDAAGPYVMMAGADMTAQRRNVRTGMSSGGLVQVSQGLEAGERVIVSGAADLIEGEAIRVAR